MLLKSRSTQWLKPPTVAFSGTYMMQLAGIYSHLFSMDAKFGFDDNAEFRQADIFSLRDISQEEPSEVEAQKAGLNFIKLDGSIGCLVNGAGLAMATMDVLSLHGGNPANFLDVGGCVNHLSKQWLLSLTRIEEELRLRQSRKRSKFCSRTPRSRAYLSTSSEVCGALKSSCSTSQRGIGIMRCDYIAEGVIKATQELSLTIPLVVRLKGTKENEAKAYVFSRSSSGQAAYSFGRMIKESGLKIIAFDGLDDAAEEAVRLAQ